MHAGLECLMFVLLTAFLARCIQYDSAKAIVVFEIHHIEIEY